MKPTTKIPETPKFPKIMVTNPFLGGFNPNYGSTKLELFRTYSPTILKLIDFSGQNSRSLSFDSTGKVIRAAGELLLEEALPPGRRSRLRFQVLQLSQPSRTPL